MRKILFLFLLLSPKFAQSQLYKDSVVCKIQANEKLINTDEYQLIMYGDKTHLLSFFQKDSSYFIQYDSKKYGPFDAFQEWESNPSYLDWAVKKDGFWYQLILDKDKLFGPYENVIDVYRDASNQHFGFRANNGNDHFVIIDGEKFGPYEYLNSGLPKFSKNGENWLFTYRKGDSTYAKTKFEELNLSNLKLSDSYLYLNDKDLDFIEYEGGYSGYSSVGIKIDAGKNGVVYFLSDPKFFPKQSDWGSPKVEEFSYNDRTYYVLIAATSQFYSKKGEFGKPFNRKLRSTFINGMKLGIVQNYLVKENGEFIPIYSNNTSGVSQKRAKWSTTNEPIKIENYIYLDQKIFGPFKKVKEYSFESNNKNDFYCIVNEENELFYNGKLTGLKNVNNVILSENSSNFILKTENNDVYVNRKLIGKFNSSIFSISDDGKYFGILYKKNNNDYYYYSNSLKIEKGPFLLNDNFRFVISENFQDVAFNDGSVQINGKKISENSFSLKYLKESNCFEWISLKNDEMHRHSYKLK